MSKYTSYDFGSIKPGKSRNYPRLIFNHKKLYGALYRYSERHNVKLKTQVSLDGLTQIVYRLKEK
jgi:hypothetical protein